MSINLWIFMFMNLVVLLPTPTKAATTSAKLSGFTYSESYKSGEDYNVKVNLTGSGTVGISSLSTLGRQVGTPKSLGLNATFNFDIRCGDTVTLTIDGVQKIVKSPACTNEVSTCQNPVGWVESVVPVQTGIAATDPSKKATTIDPKGANWTRYDFAIDKKAIRFDDNPTDNPDKFRGVVCAGTSKQNFAVVDTNGKDTGKFQKVANKIIAKEFGKFSYVSSGNDYKAYFAKNAGDGFYFETKDGTKIEVVNVSVGGVKLNSKTAPSLNVDSITYYSVLPDIDLVYQLDNEGVSKQLILRNQNALKNNLSKIEFTLAGGDLKKESPTKVKLDQKIADAKVDKNSTNVVDIKKQKEVVNALLPVAKGPTIVKPVDDFNLNQLENAKSTELDTLAKKIDAKQDVDVASEIDRIDNLPVNDEKVLLKSGNTDLKVDLPLSYSQNDTTLLKSESIKVSSDGKKLTILPDLNAIKALDKKYFPYVIDPRFAGSFSSAADALVANEGSKSRNWGGSQSLIVGGRYEGGTAVIVQSGSCSDYKTIINGLYQCPIGDARTFISINFPNVPLNLVSEAYLHLSQYGAWASGPWDADIYYSNSFNEYNISYYSQPGTGGFMGSLVFQNYNSNSSSIDIPSTNLSNIIKDQNGSINFVIVDRSATSKSATFCSREAPNIFGGPCAGYKGPYISIYLNGMPQPPINYGMNPQDKVAGCVGLNCGNSLDVYNDLGNVNDGYGTVCDSNNITSRRWEWDAFVVWRSTYNYLGINNGLFWDMNDRHVADYGGRCGSRFGYKERKLSGTYFNHFQYYNTDLVSSGDSEQTSYTVDTSAPVQIAPNSTNIPKIKNNGNITFTVPEFIDDARVNVSIENIEGGILDSGGGSVIPFNNKDVYAPTYVFPTYQPNNIFHGWVIESNGQIRSLADGRCLTHQGGYQDMATVRCRFNTSYTSNIDQIWQYLPETKQIQYMNDRRWCVTKSGARLWLNICDTSNSQKWNVIVRGGIPWTDLVNYANKIVQYKVYAQDVSPGAIPIIGRDAILTNPQTEWNTTRDISFSNLLNGKTYKFFMTARDRTVGTANYSELLYLGTTTIDTDPPIITNYTQTTKLFSPNNSTSVGVFDSVTLSYDYFDKNPYVTYLTIFPDANINSVRELPSNIAIDTVGANNVRVEFKWDGKDRNGNYVPDGTYVIRALSVDQTCNGISWDSPNCNRYNLFAPNALRVKVDNTGANINVTIPENNISVNNNSYQINGGVASYVTPGTEGNDVASLYINNESIPFVLGGKDSGGKDIYNYTKNITLNPGINNYTFRSIDTVGNQIFQYKQTDLKGNILNTQSNLVINYDPNPPEIQNVFDLTPAGSIKTTKTFKFTFADTGASPTGIDTNNITIDLFSSTKEKIIGLYTQLVNAGQVINPNFVTSNICTTTDCTITLKNLPDGYFQLFVGISDKAKNRACTFLGSPESGCQKLAGFENIFQVGTPIAGNLAGNDGDISRSLLSVDLFPTYDGVNNKRILDELAAGTRNVDKVEGMKIRLKVSQGTEAVDLDFTYDTAISYPCSAGSQTTQCNKHIATLNNSLDTRVQYLGQNKNVAVTGDNYQVQKSQISFSKCLQSECIWEYYLVYDNLADGVTPRFGGGFPKMTITSYKAKNANVLNIESQTKSWEVNGQLKGEPRVILFDKIDSDPINANVYTTNGVKLFYTNNLKNRILIGSDAGKTYLLTFRNGATTFNQSFTNDSFGSTYVDITLPGADGIWDIVYNGLVIQKFVLDRVVPTLVNVKTTNTNISKGIIPFIRRGDNVQFDYATSEPLWDSNLILDQTQKVFAEKVTIGCENVPAYTLQYGQGTQACNDAWRNSSQNVSRYQINNFTPGVAQGSDGIVSPKIELVDYAGNKGSYSSTETAINYSQTPRGITNGNSDFRLFADSVGPDKSDFDSSTWLDGKDGVNADGLTPENDRLPAPGNIKWVIRGTTITFKARGEKNARAVFVIGGSETVANATSTNCTTGNNTVLNGLIVKFGDLCDLSFSYNWPGQGLQDGQAQAIDYQNFQFYTIDLSGNASAYSSPITIWNDRTGSVAPNVVPFTATNNTKPVIDGNITRSYGINVTQLGETKAEVITTVTSPKNVVVKVIGKQSYFVPINGAPYIQFLDYIGGAEFALGAQVDDSNTTMSNDRRIGTDSDGIYTVNVVNVDTSGNIGAPTIRTIERDTVAPNPPTAIVKPDEDNFSVSLQVSGESGTIAVISGASSSEGPIANPVQGIWKGNYVYNGTYVWNVALRDRAGNVSATTQVSYTTKAAPVLTSYSLSDSTCKNSDTTKILLLPYVGTHTMTSGFGQRSDGKGGFEYHNGIDYNLIDEKVIASADGTVVSTADDPTGDGGHMVQIQHANGLKSIYAHLSYIQVKYGEVVKAGQTIAISGRSGAKVTGPHLHFWVKLNGVDRNPNDFLYACDKVTPPALVQKREDLKPELQVPSTGGADHYNSYTYAGLQQLYNTKNVVEIWLNEKGIVTKSFVNKTNSVTLDVQRSPGQIDVYGIGVPKGQAWTYIVHHKIRPECTISGWVCGDTFNEKTDTWEEPNSKIAGTISLVDANQQSAFDSGVIPINYGDIKPSDIGADGRWHVTLLQKAGELYQLPGSQNYIDVSAGNVFGLSTRKLYSIPGTELVKVLNSLSNVLTTDQLAGINAGLIGDIGAVDDNSNVKVIAPSNKYTSLDQNLYVTGDWVKDVNAYYDPKYLDTRIVKFIVDQKNILKTKPTQINLFIHGLDKDGPGNLDRNNTTDVRSFDKWILLKSDSTFVSMAAAQSNDDPNTLNIAVSWKDASYNNIFVTGQPTEAARWVVPVAEVVARQLAGFISANNINPAINCTGHSLGSLLCKELGGAVSLKYLPNTKLNKLVVLDPPGEKQRSYILDGRLIGATMDTDNYFSKVYYTNNTYSTSIAFSGLDSICGNTDLARTANIFTTIDFNIGFARDAAGYCLIHSKINDFYTKLLKGERKISFSDLGNKSILDLIKTDTTNKANFAGVTLGNIFIELIGNDNLDIKDVIRATATGSKIYFGTDFGNIFK